MSAKYSLLKQQPFNQSNDVFDYGSPFDYSSLFNESQNYKSVFTYSDGKLSTFDTCAIAETHDESFLSRCLRIVISSLCYLLLIMTFPISLLVCLKRVPSLQRIVLIRLGKLQPVKGPGMVLVFPCVDQSSRVDLKSRTLILKPEQVLTSDGGIVEIVAEIEYQVADVISFVLRVHQLEQTFCRLSHHCLVNIASEKKQSDFESDRWLLETELQNELNRTVISWGLEIIAIKIPPVKILKPADPVDVVGNIVSSLKPVLDVAFKESSVRGSKSIASEKAQTLLEMLQPHTERKDPLLKTATDLCNKAVEKELFKGKKITCKLQVDDRILYCCFNGNTVEIKENEDIPYDAAATVSKKNLDDILAKRLSPMDAYQQEKLIVTGDWKLLYIFNKFLSL